MQALRGYAALKTIEDLIRNAFPKTLAVKRVDEDRIIVEVRMDSKPRRGSRGR